jgi:hypothetical protein
VRAAAPFIIFATAATETELKAAIICALRCKVMAAAPPPLNKSVSTPPLLVIYLSIRQQQSERSQIFQMLSPPSRCSLNFLIGTMQLRAMLKLSWLEQINMPTQ